MVRNTAREIAIHLSYELSFTDKPIDTLLDERLTADAFAEDIQRCLECGMNAHIAKPIDVAELTRLLKKHSRKV